jgi:hypothetical protein
VNAVGLAPHWHARAGTVAPGPAVIFDLDGVIADAGHRQRFLHLAEPDWDGFYGSAHLDGVLEAGRALTRAIRPDAVVIVLTGRVDDVSDVTRDWLDANGVRWDLLICRPPEDDDSRHAVDYKRDEVALLRAAGFDLVLAIDDNRRIVAMYDEAGIPAVYYPSGYYDNSARYDGGV